MLAVALSNIWKSRPISMTWHISIDIFGVMNVLLYFYICFDVYLICSPYSLLCTQNGWLEEIISRETFLQTCEVLWSLETNICEIIPGGLVIFIHWQTTASRLCKLVRFSTVIRIVYAKVNMYLINWNILSFGSIIVIYVSYFSCQFFGQTKIKMPINRIYFLRVMFKVYAINYVLRVFMLRFKHSPM